MVKRKCEYFFEAGCQLLEHYILILSELRLTAIPRKSVTMWSRSSDYSIGLTILTTIELGAELNLSLLETSILADSALNLFP